MSKANSSIKTCPVVDDLRAQPFTRAVPVGGGMTSSDVVDVDRPVIADPWGNDGESALRDALQCEQVVSFSDAESGLDAIVAIHSTALGPALGGMRFCAYPSRAAALSDAVRLAAGMTYKAAAAGLDLGGGKAVVSGDAAKLRGERLLRAFGRFVETLGGRYVTAEDVGTTEQDMAMVRRETRWVVGLPPRLGGLGDPSPSTAVGVAAAIEAAVQFVQGAGSLNGSSVCVIGVGKVGSRLTELLVEKGAVVTVADVDGRASAAVEDRLGVRVVSPEEAMHLEVDVLAPCALGGVLTPPAIESLRCSIVAGAANNQLADPACADLLTARGIVYVPDFVANAGGLVHVAHEFSGGSLADVAAALEGVAPRVVEVLGLASQAGISTHQAALMLAERRIHGVGGLRRVRVPKAD